MAFVVARRDGRFEIRESALTPRGPRARTLAVFRAISPAVLDHAEERAGAPLDRDALSARARALGAPACDDAAVLARELLGEMQRGRRVPAALAAAVAAGLGGRGTWSPPDSVAPALDWMGVSDERRGRALRDLLRLASRVPPRPRPATLDFPPLTPALRDAA